MSDIVFVTWDGGGNVPPAIALARELSTRGHTVRFVGHARQAEAIGRAGFEFVPGREARAFSALDDNSLFTMTRTFADAGMGRDLLAALEARPADLVVIDCLMFGALQAAHRAGLRYAVLEHLYDGYYEQGCLRGPLGLCLRLAGRHPRAALEAAALRLVTTLPALDPVAAPPPNLRQVGPVVDVAPRVSGESSTILISLSTFGNSGMERALGELVRATRGLDARVVVTTGPAIDPAVVPTFPGVEVHRYVPHVELMPRARLFLGHGGHGSTMQALAHDLPVLVMPMSGVADQPWVGRSVVATGAGRLVRKRASAGELAPIVAELFGDGPHRAAAARLGASLRAMRGAVLGADALEEVLGAGSDVRSRARGPRGDGARGDARAAAPARSSAMRGAWLLLGTAVACGGGQSDGAGGAGGVPPSGGAGGTGATGGGGASSVPLVDAALDGHCPAGSNLPDTGVAPGDELHKVTLDAYPEAVCNDGTPAIMYVRAASAPAASTSWIIHLQAGGDCGDYEICRNRWCSYQTGYDAAKMSSRFAPEATNGTGLFGRNANNAFGAVNQVFVYYCSSDLWLGRHDDVVLDDPAGVEPSFRLHFKGFRIIEAVAAALEQGVTSDDGVEQLPSITGATRVLLAGSSAGAAGQTHALDWWAARYPGAEVAGLLDSITDPLPEDIADATIAETFATAQASNYANVHRAVFDSHLDESCLAAHAGGPDEHLCSLHSHVRLNHLTTPFFVRQDLRDPVQYGYFQQTGATMNQMADAIRLTTLRYLGVTQDAEEAVAVAPGVHVSNCGQHILLMNAPWFGTAAVGNATVEDQDGTAVTVHAALAAWIAGSGVPAIDTNPSTLSFCPQTTPDQ